MKKIILLSLVIGLNNIIHSQCIQSYSSGDWSSFAIRTDGKLFGWGQAGIQGVYGRYAPFNIGTSSDWNSISIGYDFFVAKKNNGTIWTCSLACLGSTPILPSPQQVGNESDWDKINSGHHHTLALKTNGTLWSWGLNQSGELGNGISGITTTPVQVGTDTNWLKIYAGFSHTLAIKTDGTLWSWGEGFYGQLGDGTQNNRGTPAMIGTSNNWLLATAGYNCSYGIKTDGTLWFWGQPSFGQINYTPVQVGSANNWLKVDSCGAIAVALKTDGTLWRKISNNYVQVGSQNNWQDIAAGYRHIMASQTDGSVWTWGENYTAQLGIGNSNYQTDIPLLVSCSTLSTTDFETSTFETYIYPNPSSSGLYVNGIERETDYLIINTLGQLLQFGKARPNSEIDISHLSKGIYHFSIDQKTLKIIKE